MNVVAQVEQFRSLVISFMISMYFCGRINEHLFTMNLVCLVVCLFMCQSNKNYPPYFANVACMEWFQIEAFWLHQKF
jgi:hypothetical protein